MTDQSFDWWLTELRQPETLRSEHLFRLVISNGYQADGSKYAASKLLYLQVYEPTLKVERSHLCTSYFIAGAQTN